MAPSIDLYSWVGSQWAGVPHLGIHEKKIPKDHFNVIEVDIGTGENLEPHYVAINPNGTVPSLMDPDLSSKPLVESADILRYLDDHTGAGAGAVSLFPTQKKESAKVQEIIDFVHSMDVNTDIVLLRARDQPELEEKIGAGWLTFLANRQAVLDKNHEARPEDQFYTSKAKGNGAIHHIYTNASQAEREAFFAESRELYKNFISELKKFDGILTLPYAAGENVTAADLHAAPWFAHMLAHTGTKDPVDFSKIEVHFANSEPGFEIGDNVKAWWKNFTQRESFKTVYAVLH